jgi:Ion channel
MRKWLKNFFEAHIRKRAVLTGRRAFALAALWVFASAALEYLGESVASRLTDWGSVLLALVVGFALSYVVAALLGRLLEIINGQRAATVTDLGYIGYAYVFVIAAFGAIFLAADTFGGESFVRTNNFRAPLKIIDHLYLSGITIATVGYGDIVPRTVPTKLLVVLEAMVGLWLSVTVLGVFIGSLLGRQLQDKQARFFRDFQHVYFEAMTKCQDTVDDLDALKPEDLSVFRRNILITIATLVKLQYEPSPGAKINANWMRFYTGTEAPARAINQARRFATPHLNSSEQKMRAVWGVLVLQEWDETPSNMPDKDQFSLPVYNPYSDGESRAQLPGAPQAVGSEKGYVIVSDSQKMDFSRQDEDVINRLRDYFSSQAKDVRSFASVRIGPRDNPIGVINIQSNEPDLCGNSPEAQTILVDMMHPFARYLALAGGTPVPGITPVAGSTPASGKRSAKR